MADAATSYTSELPGVISTVFWLSLGVAIVVRGIIAVRRRKAESVRRGILKPITSSAAVQSAAYGWKPSDSEHVLTVEQQSESSSVYPMEVDDGGESDDDGEASDEHAREADADDKDDH